MLRPSQVGQAAGWLHSRYGSEPVKCYADTASNS